MKKQQAVYQLIHGLNEKEKAAMDDRLMPSRGEGAKYQQLYWFFDNLPVYDEDQIEEAAKQQGWEKSFRSTIKYLHEILLKELARFDEDQDQEAQIYRHFKQARALKRRGHYEMAIDEIESALKKAERYEWASMVNEAAILRIVQLLDTEEFKLSKSIEQFLALADVSVQRISRANKINQFYFRISNPILTRRDLADQKAALIDAILKEWGPNHKMPDVDFLARHRYCILRYHCAKHQDDHSDMRHWAKQGVDLFKSNAAFQKAHPEKYIQALNLYNNCLFYLEDWATLKLQYQELDQMEGENEWQQAEIFQVFCLNQLHYWLNKAELTKIDTDQLQSFNQKLRDLGPLIRQNRRMVIAYHIGLIHFIRGEYVQATPIWDQHIDLNRKMERVENIQRTILLLQLIIDFEDGHWNLETQATAVRNKLTLWGKVTREERMLINGIRRLVPHLRLDSKTKEVLEKLKDEFLSFIEEQNKNETPLNQPTGEILFWLRRYFEDLPDPRTL